MRHIKCADCEEYRNEWCEKIVDSPHPDMFRDCQYWHERKDMVEVVRCKDCVWRDDIRHWLGCPILNTDDDNYCSFAEPYGGESE